ncbi:hypothetical protein THRCLA_11858 [Thraustotheca clavata]|uniref:Uncharacterized protein n=1 Tax=Thraustotheca clavata TaxID=74557 RepID=A0A1V9Y6C6_9STRA|nr:hypothetical protein THRCLA_11858 [Thraustotheca clavata]
MDEPLPNIVFLFEGETCNHHKCFEEVINDPSNALGPFDVILVPCQAWLDESRPCLIQRMPGHLAVDINIDGPKSDCHGGIVGGSIREPILDLVALTHKLVDPLTGHFTAPTFYDKVRNNEALSRARISSLTASSNSSILSRLASTTLNLQTAPNQCPNEVASIALTYIKDQFAQLPQFNKLHLTVTRNDVWCYEDPNNKFFQASIQAMEKVWSKPPQLIATNHTSQVASILKTTHAAPIMLLGFTKESTGSIERIPMRNITLARDFMVEFLSTIAQDNFVNTFQVSKPTNIHTPIPLASKLKTNYQTSRYLSFDWLQHAAYYCLYLIVLVFCASLLSFVWQYETIDRFKLLDYNTLKEKIAEQYNFSQNAIVVHGTDVSLPLVASLAQELRSLGNKDRFLVYHCNGELSPLSQRILHFIDAELDIYDVCQELLEMKLISPYDIDGYRNGYLKVLMLLHAPADQVLLIDASTILMHDPNILRKSQGYIDTGTFFFYDREAYAQQHLLGRGYTAFGSSKTLSSTHLHQLVDNFEYELFDSKKSISQHLENTLAWNGHSHSEQDTAVIAINKKVTSRVYPLLWFLLHDIRHRVAFSNKDNDFFWLAFELLNLPYHFSPWAATSTANTQSPSLYGGLGQYLPEDDNSKSLLYLNARNLVDPYDASSSLPHLPMQAVIDRLHQLHNSIPKYIVPRRTRSANAAKENDAIHYIAKLGSQELDSEVISQIQRRAARAVAIAHVQQREMVNLD